jgi:LPS-assembly lipoprotein
MWWRRTKIGQSRLGRRIGRLATIALLAGTTAGCWHPLYGEAPPGSDSVRDKLAAVEIPVVAAPKGTAAERVAVALRNELQYQFNGSSGAFAPIYRLNVNTSASQITVGIDPVSGRPNTQIGIVAASYSLVELATGKTVLSDTVYQHVDYDVPGTEQRFAKQRAQRDAEDHAVIMAADAIKSRIESYFVAGT